MAKHGGITENPRGTAAAAGESFPRPLGKENGEGDESCDNNDEESAQISSSDVPDDVPSDCFCSAAAMLSSSSSSSGSRKSPISPSAFQGGHAGKFGGIEKIQNGVIQELENQ
jgi:hypothetical protein